MGEAGRLGSEYGSSRRKRYVGGMREDGEHALCVSVAAGPELLVVEGVERSLVGWWFRSCGRVGLNKKRDGREYSNAAGGKRGGRLNPLHLACGVVASYSSLSLPCFTLDTPRFPHLRLILATRFSADCSLGGYTSTSDWATTGRRRLGAEGAAAEARVAGPLTTAAGTPRATPTPRTPSATGGSATTRDQRLLGRD